MGEQQAKVAFNLTAKQLMAAFTERELEILSQLGLSMKKLSFLMKEHDARLANSKLNPDPVQPL